LDKNQDGPGWPAIYQYLAATYGWTPQQINELTFFQLAIYTGAITPEHGRTRLSPADARSVIAQKQNSGMQ
jgi:hypothetical protein